MSHLFFVTGILGWFFVISILKQFIPKEIVQLLVNCALLSYGTVITYLLVQKSQK